MAKDDFTIEQLDNTYDDAMAWKPPGAAAPAIPQADARAILRRLIQQRSKRQQYSANEATQIEQNSPLT